MTPLILALALLGQLNPDRCPDHPLSQRRAHPIACATCQAWDEAQYGASEVVPADPDARPGDAWDRAHQIRRPAVVLTAASTGQPTQILDFGATWCGPCRQMAPAIKRLEAAGYPVREIDIDADSRTASRYKVTAVPTLILVDSQGGEIDRRSGAMSAGAIGTWYNSKVLGTSKVVQTPTASGPDDSYQGISARINVAGGAGSGVLVGSNGLVITAAHMFRDPGTLKMHRFSSIKVRISGETVDGQLLGVHPSDDLAAVSIAPRGPGATVATESSKKAWIIGFGASGNLHQHQLHFIEERGREWVFRGEIGHGDSGAGVFNERGELIGVAVAYESYDRSRNIVVSSLALKQFLRSDTCLKLSLVLGRPRTPKNAPPPAPTTPEEPVPPAATSPAPAPVAQPPAPVAQPAQPVVINGKDGTNGANGKDGTAPDLTPILTRLTAAETAIATLKTDVAKPITFAGSDGSMQQAQLGDIVKLKVPTTPTAPTPAK